MNYYTKLLHLLQKIGREREIEREIEKCRETERCFYTVRLIPFGEVV